MALRSLNQLRSLRVMLMRLRTLWLNGIVGVRAPLSIQPSFSSRIRPGRRGSIEIGENTLISFKTLIYSYDARTGRDRPVRIGSGCFIGGGAMVLPGVTIGDGAIVGGGSVVFDDVPPRSIVVGNPAKVLRRDIEAGPYGRLSGADENTARLWSWRD